MDKEKIFDILISLVLIFGLIEIILQPIAIHKKINREFFLKLVLNIPTIFGTIYLLFNEKLEKREDFSYWKIVGIAMFLIGGLFPIIQEAYFGAFYGKELEWFIQILSNLTELSIYGIIFGFLLIFYNLEDDKKGLTFIFPIFIFLILVFLYNTLYNTHFFDFGFGYSIYRTYISTNNGIRIWIFPNCMWSAIFWSDLTVSTALIALFSIKIIPFYLKVFREFVKKKFSKKEETAY